MYLVNSKAKRWYGRERLWARREKNSQSLLVSNSSTVAFQISREKQTADSLNCFRYFVLGLVSRPNLGFRLPLTLISIAKTLHSKCEQKLLMTSRLDHKSTGDNSKFYIKDSIIKQMKQQRFVHSLLFHRFMNTTPAGLFTFSLKDLKQKIPKHNK